MESDEDEYGAGQSYDNDDEIALSPRAKRIKSMNRLPKDCAAFEIDSFGGRVAFLYLNGSNSNPQIWCQDNSCSWFFMASTFTDYFRLMIMHLGLPCWQYAYTTVGLDPVSQQWFASYPLRDWQLIQMEAGAVNWDCYAQRIHHCGQSSETRLSQVKVTSP